MEDGIKAVRQHVHEMVLTYVRLNDTQRVLFRKMLDVVEFARQQGIDGDDIVAVLQQVFDEVTADEAGTAGNEYTHGRGES